MGSISSILAEFKKVSESYTVDTITYTWLVENHKVNRVDLFVLDVEGHELKCLKGASEIIEKSKKLVLVIEIDDNCLNVGVEKNEILDFLFKKNFKAYLPKGYPFKMKEIKSIPENHADNVIFIKQ